MDPNNKVAGRGIQRLIDAGINVQVGFLEAKCNELNKRFFTFHQKRRPYIILKWAQSQDGFIAPTLRQAQDDIKEKKPVWITSKHSRQLVHKWRSEEQAILIGTQTAIDDNPKLDVRDWTGTNPTRFVLDRHNRIPRDNSIFDNQVKTVIICESTTEKSSENCIFESIDFKKEISIQITTLLYKHEIQSVIIEGGRQTLQTFIDNNLWDEALVFTGNNRFTNGTEAPTFNFPWSEKQLMDQDELKIYKNHD